MTNALIAILASAFCACGSSPVVDGVLYEVIVVKPQLGTMIPVGRDASE